MQGVFIGGDLILTLLICLIIPGFLGYLVFKYTVQEDLDRRSESSQIAMMLLLGISGIASLCAINFLLRPFPDVASFISPDELMLKKLDVKFWTSYLALFCTSMLSGAFWAFISERGIAPTLLLSRGICYCLKHSGKIPCESAMRFLIDQMQEQNHNPSLVRVRELGKTQGLIGWWNGFSESEKEINLALVECCDATTDLSNKFDLYPRKCIINYETGFIVEFLDVNEEYADRFYDIIVAEYKKLCEKLIG